MTNDGENELGFEIRDIVGKGRTLEFAYDDFARQVAERAHESGISEEEAAKRFDANPIRTEVEVVVLPHNEWVKAYWVKAY